MPHTSSIGIEKDRLAETRAQSWKSIYMVLRPNLLSIYRDKNETKLRHQITLSDLTAVARQKDPKRREKHVFGLFSPARNYHLEALSDKDAQEWVDAIGREARIAEHEEEMFLASPGGAHTSPYQGFERSMDPQTKTGAEDRAGGYASSSDAGDGLSPSYALPKVRDRDKPNMSAGAGRHPSYAEYSGADRGSISDFSDTMGPAARLSALSLSHTDPRPSTSSTQAPAPNTVYGSMPSRPSIGVRNASQISNLRLSTDDSKRALDEERVVYHSYIYLLKSKSGMRQWKKVWLVVRSKAMALYKSEDEYAALLIMPFSNVIDAVEIDPISKSKTFCMQIITEERNYRFCALDEESLARCLGAFKSLLSKRKARQKEKEVAPVAVAA